MYERPGRQTEHRHESGALALTDASRHDVENAGAGDQEHHERRGDESE
jgi:hypothetical protein